MSEVPVVVFEEPVFGRSFDVKKRKLKDPPKEATIKKLKQEFAKFAAHSVTDKKKYRYSQIVELGAVPEKDKKIPLPLKRKFEAAKKKRQEKDIALGKLDVTCKKKSNNRRAGRTKKSKVKS